MFQIFGDISSHYADSMYQVMGLYIWYLLTIVNPIDYYIIDNN